MEVANTDRKVQAALIGSAGESQAVTVAGTREFIEMLSSNLYSRPQEAIVREVLCNSDDAHKDNNYDGPIEITISDEYTLSIRDHGKGIPHEMMGEIYGTYGGSTKKKDSMATGGFGLGCKSPWSYCDVFTVVNHHAGEAVIYSMLRVSPDHDGLPAIVPLARYPSQETGVEVRIDLKAGDVNNFNQLIRSIVRRGGMNATLNGNKLDAIEYDAEASYKLLVRSQMGQRIMVKYGAVLYPVERHEIYGALYDQVNQYMPIGDTLILQAAPDSLIISPNRENVSYLDKTVKTIWELIRAFMTEINDKAEPYAKSLICYLNTKHIDQNGALWMTGDVGAAHWLIQPGFGSSFYKLDVFHQVIHSRLANVYPAHLHKMAVEDRFSKTNKLIVGKRKREFFAAFKKMFRKGKTDSGNTPKTRNRFVRDYILRELFRVARRGDLNLNNLRFGSNSSLYYPGMNKSTQLPQLVKDFRHLMGRNLGEQWRQWADVPIVISHTMRGPLDSTRCPPYYFLYVVPRKEDEVKRVIAHFKKHNWDVLDITDEQKITSGPRKEKAKGYPTIGFLRKAKRWDTQKMPMLNYSKDCKKEIDLVEEPRFYIKTAIRSNTTQYDPTDMSSYVWRRFAPDIVPDDTAVVTTDADVKRLKKSDAVHVMQYIYDELCGYWRDPEVRKLFAHLMPDTGGSNQYDRSLSELRTVINNPWYQNTFDLKVKWTDDLETKVHRLGYYFTHQYEFHNTGDHGVKDTNSLYRQMSDVRKQGEPKKLKAVFDFLEENPVVEIIDINMERLIDRSQHHPNQVIKNKLVRILSIIME